ncbi:MAG: hypothetical protein AB7P69_17615 [Candidatus Binatia bacterium]
MRRTIRINCSLLLNFVLLTCVGSAQATTAIEQTFPDLVHRADVIAVGTVTAIQERWDAARQAPFTDVTFSHLTVMKGNVDGPTMMLEFLGGHTPDGAILSVSDVPQFTVGEKTVVFCAGNHRDFCPLVGLWQGRMRVTFDAQRGVEAISDTFRVPIVGVQDGQLVKALSAEQQHEALPLATFLDLIRQELGNSYRQP